MKCPICRYINDPEKDLCGRCFSDLRPSKQELGLKILEPGLAYEELLAKKVKIVRKKSPSDIADKSAGFSFFKFFRRVKKSQQAELNQTAQIVEQQAVPESPIEDLSEDVLKADKKPQGLRLAKRQKEQVVALLRRRQEGLESTKTDERGIGQVCSLSFPELLPLEQEVGQLFATLGRELEQTAQSHLAVTAFNRTHFVSSDAQAAIQVLFEMTSKELLEPENVRQFVDPLSLKKIESISSSDLDKAVNTFHKEHVLYERARAQTEFEPGQTFFGLRASLGSRLLACLLDFAVCFIAGFLLALVRQATVTPWLSGMMLSEIALNFADILSVLLYSLIFFLPLNLLCLPLLRTFMGQTVGEKLLSLRLVNNRNATPGLLQSLFWNVSSSLTIISLGIFEISASNLLGREKICCTKILRSQAP